MHPGSIQEAVTINITSCVQTLTKMPQETRSENTTDYKDVHNTICSSLAVITQPELTVNQKLVNSKPFSSLAQPIPLAFVCNKKTPFSY